jgi:hypothetical protein
MHGDDLIVKAREAPFVLGNQQRVQLWQLSLKCFPNFAPYMPSQSAISSITIDCHKHALDSNRAMTHCIGIDRILQFSAVLNAPYSGTSPDSRGFLRP